MARMEPVPGGRMASNCCTPNIPRLEIVNVPIDVYMCVDVYINIG